MGHWVHTHPSDVKRSGGVRNRPPPSRLRDWTSGPHCYNCRAPIPVRIRRENSQEDDLTIQDLFSYRQRLTEGNVPDVFVYDDLPRELRIQIIHIWRQAIGPFQLHRGRSLGGAGQNNDAWETIEKIVAREHGVFQLGDHRNRDVALRCEMYLLDSPSIDRALDLVEASFRHIDAAGHYSRIAREQRGITQSPRSAIAELNERFRRAGVGYSYESGKITRVDSELIHSQVVQPALLFLNQPGFEGPREEFLDAHAHYRSGEYRDAITDANSAFESTVKAICNQRGWEFSPGASASELLKTVRSNGLLPNYLDNSFDQLAATLSSGLPRVRNNEGAHGQGATPAKTPAYVAAYALHLAATNIVFLAEAHREAKGQIVSQKKGV